MALLKAAAVFMIICTILSMLWHTDFPIYLTKKKKTKRWLKNKS